MGSVDRISEAGAPRLLRLHRKKPGMRNRKGSYSLETRYSTLTNYSVNHTDSYLAAVALIVAAACRNYVGSWVGVHCGGSAFGSLVSCLGEGALGSHNSEEVVACWVDRNRVGQLSEGSGLQALWIAYYFDMPPF